MPRKWQSRRLVRLGSVPYNSEARRYRGDPPSLKLWRTRRTSKHVFLRNEPEFPTRKYEWMLQGYRMLGRAKRYLQSGSFGGKWAQDRDRCHERQRRIRQGVSGFAQGVVRGWLTCGEGFVSQ